MARGGPALLAGLVVCCRCGWRMYAHHNHAQRPRYTCPHSDPVRDGTSCPSLPVRLVEELVCAQVPRSLEPAALALNG